MIDEARNQLTFLELYVYGKNMSLEIDICIPGSFSSDHIESAPIYLQYHSDVDRIYIYILNPSSFLGLTTKPLN